MSTRGGSWRQLTSFPRSSGVPYQFGDTTRVHGDSFWNMRRTANVTFNELSTPIIG